MAYTAIFILLKERKGGREEEKGGGRENWSSKNYHS